ncbi:hypothetical protein PSTT_13556 [Puccinia striiformis]|uniref:Uncharacterized protein n=1 Tax=Puccinia striiformis TaxID=27350 RepID=A0A2S4UR48_9BASI|nr:hypothetical protein PSTT_13556 [Puccinia striiformis]
MAFSLPMVSILMSWISYSAVNAHPFGMFGGGGMPGMSGGMSGLGGGGGMPGFGGGGMPGLGGGGGAQIPSRPNCPHPAKKLQTLLSTGELATCANIPALIAISKTEGSIVSAINTWVTGACAAVPCSKDALASAAEKIKKDCQKDLDDGSARPLVSTPTSSTTKKPGTHFALKPRATRSFVFLQLWRHSKPRLAKSSPMQGLSQPWLVKSPEALAFIRVPKEAYCTPCTHALGTQSEIMVEAISKDPKIKFEHSTTQAKGKASEICGASFDDKKIPDSIQIAAPGNGKADAPGGKAKADGPKDTEVAPEKKPKDADASATKPLDAGAGAGAGTETPKDGPTTPENSESTKEATEKPKAEESSSEEA